MAGSNGSPADVNSLKNKFDDWTVSKILSTISSLEPDEAVPGGDGSTSASALNKAAAFIYNNGALIDKLVDYLQISVNDTANGTIPLFNPNESFEVEGDTGAIVTPGWTSCINALSNILTSEASAVKPGVYWDETSKCYELTASISVNLSHFYNAAMNNGTNSENSFELSATGITVVLDVFGDLSSQLEQSVPTDSIEA